MAAKLALILVLPLVACAEVEPSNVPVVDAASEATSGDAGDGYASPEHGDANGTDANRIDGDASVDAPKEAGPCTFLNVTGNPNVGGKWLCVNPKGPGCTYSQAESAYVCPTEYGDAGMP